ncbi:hypothetical protein JANAI62_18730 [Jannaschia pagri]|uniref:Glycosyltransferase 2-like domain-containing protein n=1 Tax=Jannaschia pagri TaxID=2829797 RepID=A0ABQ4NLZ1_9RHOB|nr:MULTISPECIES: glycosyltransferase family A protein [unclassified Jannaschia]GIT91416.1 hypothetical protein JANAI61_18740 [Jannaschia sp. AI_61]GIT95250.1 hypothetical protein JANAI62_18730 [Jannaschia sp. AI_62]
MLPVLPDHLTTLLKSAGKFADVLRRTGFPDTEAIADLEGIASRKGLGAAYDHARSRQGYLAFAEDTITGVHSGPAFDAHAQQLIDQGEAVPRLKSLVPDRPPMEAWQANVLSAFAEALLSGKDPLGMADGYLYGSGFAELGLPAGRAELMEVFCTDHPRAALVLMDHIEALVDRPEVLQPLLRFGLRYFTTNRYFQKTYDLCRFFRDTYGLRGQDVGDVLDRLWYAAFRLGRREEALETLDHWATLRPVLKRPLVYRALVTSVTDPALATELLEDAGAALGRSTVGGNAIYVEQALREGRLREAESAIRNAIYEAERTDEGIVPQDYLISLHNVLIARGRPSRALDRVFFDQEIKLRWDGHFGLDTVEDVSGRSAVTRGRVAIVMTAFRAEAFLERAMMGVLGQSHRDLELIVVDDCSDDGTVEIVQRLAREDARVRYLRTPRNMGTYGAKNLGIRDALTRASEFVTLCDSDDFWLRNHLSVHLSAMAEMPDTVCTTSQWIRVRDDGTIEAGLRGRYVETCPHSTFFHRSVFDQVGLFDAVRFGADREFLNRVGLHFGPQAVRPIHSLLTLGRRHDASLTTAGAGAISQFNESPLRLQYWQAWNEWHVASLKAGRLPHTDGDPDAAERPFVAPGGMMP